MGAFALGSQLNEAGFETLVFDFFTRHPDPIGFIEKIATDQLLLIGISSSFLSPSIDFHNSNRIEESATSYYSGYLWESDGQRLVSWIEKLKNRLKEKSPKVKIVLGGAKAPFSARSPEIYSAFDYICVGAGDDKLVELARSISANLPPKVMKVNGLNYLDNPKLKKDLDICPVTHYSDRWAIQPNESLTIEIARGCVFNCKFCYHERKKSIRKPLDQIRNELIYNYEKFNTTVYHFCDDCFNDSKSKVEDYCNLFLSLPFKIEWISYVRVDIALRYPETVDLMVKSGARGLFWGLETFHAETARKSGKGFEPEKVKQFLIDFKKKYGSECLVTGSFISGLPGEPVESILQTRDWLLSNDALDYISFHTLDVGPYNYQLDGRVVDYSDYSANPTKYGFKEVRFGAENYWRHDSMDRIKAMELANEIYEEWTRSKPRNMILSMWAYPNLRTLGFTHADITRHITDHATGKELRELYLKRIDEYLQKYFRQLERLNLPKPQQTNTELPGQPFQLR